MERPFNDTQPGGWNSFCFPFHLQVIVGAISTMLVLSLCWNMFCCVSKSSSGKALCKPRTRQRRSPRQMEDNPIYGNVGCMQSSTTLLTAVDPQHSSCLRDQRSESQSKFQDCYANLTLKALRPPSGRASPRTQSSDVVHVEEEHRRTQSSDVVHVEEEEEDEGSTVSDLYASVQSQHTKPVDTADNGEGYANISKMP